MSIFPICEDDLILATLSNHLKLNKSKLDQVLKCYSDITKAVEDNFCELYKYKNTEPENTFDDENFESDILDSSKVFKRDIKWLTLVKSFNWSRFEEYKQVLLKDLEVNQIGIIGYREFPESIISLRDHPLVLYFQGDKDVLGSTKRSISIVGSRAINHYTTKFLTDIMGQLDGYDFDVVSGLALGVDSLVHSLALEHNRRCIAFIGSGHGETVFYPSSNFKLKKQIVDAGGLVCSEYPPTFKSMPYTFPMRNRFVACVSDLTWVAQASQKSGALITSKLALEYGKIVATTPASIFDSLFEGNLSLIREGAQIIASSDDLLGLLNFFDLGKIKVKKEHVEIDWSVYSDRAKKIYDNLNYEPMDVQELFLSTSTPIAILGSELSMLEINGLVANVEYGKWVKI
jgi:DNA processing protein